MKKIILFFALSTLVFSCKNVEEKKGDDATVADQEPTSYIQNKLYHGDFIYLNDAAVLKGSNYIFGVTMDDMAAELAARIEPVKKEEFDMVPVIVKGTVAPKPEGQEGWDQILTITEILEIGPEPAKADIRLKDNN